MKNIVEVALMRIPSFTWRSFSL